MSTLAALALATPIFGFSLTPPNVGPLAFPGGLSSAPVFAQVDEAADEAEEASDEDDATPRRRQPSRNGSDLGAQLRQRNDIATVHRAFGIATWGSMLVTVILGFIQYYNLYGFFGSREDTPCVSGNAVFGQDQCWGTPWAHRIAAIATTALYGTTFILSFTMPDPLDAAEGNSGLAPDLRLHKDLRWAHLGGMIVQVLLGLAVGQNWFGLDRANDFEAQRALATVHQLVGWTTFGLLTAAGLIMLF
jgi:hypothetical protein